MPAIASGEEAARKWVVECEDREARRSCQALPAARAALSRKIGIPAGTMENIRRGRSKGVRAWVLEKLKAFVVRELETEIARLAHELEMVRATGGNGSGAAVLAARAALEKAFALLGEG